MDCLPSPSTVTYLLNGPKCFVSAILGQVLTRSRFFQIRMNLDICFYWLDMQGYQINLFHGYYNIIWSAISGHIASKSELTWDK